MQNYEISHDGRSEQKMIKENEKREKLIDQWCKEIIPQWSNACVF